MMPTDTKIDPIDAQNGVDQTEDIIWFYSYLYSSLCPFLYSIEERRVLSEVAGGRSEEEKKRNGGGEDQGGQNI